MALTRAASATPARRGNLAIGSPAYGRALLAQAEALVI